MRKAWFDNDGRYFNWNIAGDDSLDFGHLCYASGSEYHILLGMNLPQKSGNQLVFNFFRMLKAIHQTVCPGRYHICRFSLAASWKVRRSGWQMEATAR